MKVIDNIYALDATKGNYAYLIIGKGNILIDTGRPGQGNAILKELKAMNINLQNIKHILLTHHDVDHIGNAVQLQNATGAALWASKEDLPYIYGDLKRPGIKRILGSIIKVQAPKNVHTYDVQAKIGDVQVIPTPGHTPGHVCLLYKNVLFAGDLVMGSSTLLRPSPGIMTWNKAKLMDSIKKIVPLPFQWICPAHSTPVERGSLLDSFL